MVKFEICRVSFLKKFFFFFFTTEKLWDGLPVF